MNVIGNIEAEALKPSLPEFRAGDRVRVTSPTGSIVVEAKPWEGVPPGVVTKSYGQGHWAYGQIAAKAFGKEPAGGNNNEIMPADYDRLSGSTARSTRRTPK